MKRTRYQLELRAPCSEPWEGMEPRLHGRFCQSCAKQVIDFTGLTDDQVILLKKSGGTLCGRVEETQLNRDLRTRTQTFTSARLFKMFAGLFLLQASGCKLAAVGGTLPPYKSRDTTYEWPSQWLTVLAIRHGRKF